MIPLSPSQTLRSVYAGGPIKIHFQIRFHLLSAIKRMILFLLVDRVAVSCEFRSQCFLVDVFGKARAELVMYLLHTADDAVGGLD